MAVSRFNKKHDRKKIQDFTRRDKTIPTEIKLLT